MKIFFIASIAGKHNFLDDYLKIINITRKYGHHVISNHVIKDTCDMNDLKLKKEYKKYSRNIFNTLNSCDAVIAEVSYPSIMVGYLLNYSLKQRKHTLCLYQKNPHRILVGESSKLLRLKKYNSKQEKRLSIIINDFLVDTKDNALNIRFNLMLDESTNKLLEKKSKKVNLGKAEYLRKLIEENVDNS